MPGGGNVIHNVDIARAVGNGESETTFNDQRVAGRVAAGEGIRIENFKDGRRNQTWVSGRRIDMGVGGRRERGGRRVRRDDGDGHGENYGSGHVRRRDGGGPINYGGGRDNGDRGRPGQDLRGNHYYLDDSDFESVDWEDLCPHCSGILGESPPPANEGH
jgi:hypothetical protein